MSIKSIKGILIRSYNTIAIFFSFTCFSVLKRKTFLLLSSSFKYNNTLFNLLKDYKKLKNFNFPFLLLRIKLANIEQYNFILAFKILVFKIFIAYFCVISKKCFIKAKIKASFIVLIFKKISNTSLKIIKLLKKP